MRNRIPFPQHLSIVLHHKYCVKGNYQHFINLAYTGTEQFIFPSTMKRAKETPPYPHFKKEKKKEEIAFCYVQVVWLFFSIKKLNRIASEQGF